MIMSLKLVWTMKRVPGQPEPVSKYVNTQTTGENFEGQRSYCAFKGITDSPGSAGACL